MLQTNILFVDAHNDGRSILAEAYFNQQSRGGLRAFSAGINPAYDLNSSLIDVLRNNNITPDDYCAKPIDIFLQPYSPRIDLIVGFKPLVEEFKLPIFTNHPPVTNLNVVPVVERIDREGLRKAYQNCFADIGFAIDRALAAGQLPAYQAA